MSKSIIYAGTSNQTATTVAGVTLPFSNIVRRYGCNLKLEGANVVTVGAGYYSGVVNITAEGTGAGTLILTVYDNGVAVPYASAEVTMTADDFASVAIPFAIRANCNCVDHAITVVASGVVSNVVNSSIYVEKE